VCYTLLQNKLMNMSDKKNALVTGASGNLGKAIVKKLVEDEYKVFGTVVPNDPTVFDFSSNEFEKRTVDLSSESESVAMVEGIIASSNTIDVAVLTVGGFAMGSIESTSLSEIEKQYKLNFETTYNVARPVFVQMLKQNKGRLFMVGSRPGLEARSGKGLVAYSLAKSLIFRLAELMNEEAKNTKVVVSVIVPSTIDTPQNRQSMPTAEFKAWVKPEAIAEVISYYCSEKAAVLREPIIKVYNRS
jgi:NAD(P)-dependent dehydrogenase (short-subunit alcohol dehydrogenase family)